MVKATEALCKLERQLLLHGWTHLHNHPEACLVLGHYFELVRATQSQQQRLLEAAAAGSLRAAAAAAVLMPILLIPTKMLMEVQDLQPLAMCDVLPNAISFFLQQISSRSFKRGAGDVDEKFLVRGLTFLRNALSTSAYMVTRQAPPQAHMCQQVLQSFFASPSLPQLVAALLKRALPLTRDEYDEFENDPEGFVHEEHLMRENASLRKCAERCLLTLADTHECRQPVQEAVLRLSNKAAAVDLSTLDAILALDACYCALGLVLNSGQDSMHIAGVLSTLQQHCAIAKRQHAHVLRRRGAWLVGLVLRAPYFTRFGAGVGGGSTSKLAGSGDGGNAGAPAVDQVPAAAIMYATLSDLLRDEHSGVRLAAALAVQGHFDVTDTSPCASVGFKADSVDGRADRLNEGRVLRRAATLFKITSHPCHITTLSVSPSHVIFTLTLTHILPPHHTTAHETFFSDANLPR